MLKGTGASAGVGIGHALVVKEQNLDYSAVQFAGQQQETERLKEAAAAVSQRLSNMAAEMTEKVGEHAAEILSGQIMMLNDPFMMGQMEEQIAAGNVAEAAVDSVCQTFIAMFSGMEDELMRQRATDIGDLRARLLKQLLGLPDVDLAHAPAGTVIVAQDFTPSMTGRMLWASSPRSAAAPAIPPFWPARWRFPPCWVCPVQPTPSRTVMRSPWTASSAMCM